MKSVFYSFMLLFSIAIQAQVTKEVEYVQIRRIYEFQDQPNQNRLSSMLKYHFEKMGYKVYYAEDGTPEVLKKNKCKEYICDVQRTPKMTTTELTLSLIDCNQKTVAMGKGNSRTKLRNKAYPEVLTYIFQKTPIAQMSLEKK